MPNIKSAKKRVIVNTKKNLENKMVVSEIRTYLKKFDVAVSEKNAAAAQELFKTCVSMIDSAASKGIFHRKKASRKQANLSKALASIA